ncbi:MAG: UvrD-helicase domain-containing protein [Anaerolineae bacterium]
MDLDLLAGLNPQQKEAVTAGDGPVLVLAGPGSGKTRVLTHRVAWLIAEGRAHPSQIMAVTFTNKAANEMRERLNALLRGMPGVFAMGTFHSICARMLRRFGQCIGVEPNYTIFDRGDQLAVMKEVVKGLDLDDRRYPPAGMLNLISNRKNELVTPETFEARTYWEEVARRVFAEYQRVLQQNNALDFDDLLTQAVLLLQECEDVRHLYQEQYKYVLVDEFQDTNMAQYELMRLLTGKWRNPFVVGDEDQSIYRFRGADYRNVARFRADFPDAQVVLLERNYRSTQIILDAANAVIAQNPMRTRKNLHTDRKEGPPIVLYEAYSETDEARFVVEEIRRLTAEGLVRPGQCAVMYRTNAQSRALEEAFVGAGMPYHLVGATRFYDRREIKDALAYLKIVYNPHDEVSLSRVINVPRRGIGSSTWAKLLTHARAQGQSVYTVLQAGSDAVANVVGARGANALERFAVQWRSWVEANEAGERPSRLLHWILEESGYLDWVRDGTEEGQDRWENLQELLGLATQYDDLEPEALGEDGDELTPLGLFLQEVALVSDADDLADDVDAPTLLTLHTAKGLEFDTVFITGVEEGLIPHARSIEDPEELAEERRLFYVGITRAKRYLYLSYATTRQAYGFADRRSPSSFLEDIPQHLLQKYDLLSIRNRRAEGAKVHVETARGRSVAWAPEPSLEQPVEAPRVPQFIPGDRVRHKLFGEGIVIRTELRGGDEEVTVNFQGSGTRRLLASLANLVKL